MEKYDLLRSVISLNYHSAMCSSLFIFRTSEEFVFLPCVYNYTLISLMTHLNDISPPIILWLLQYLKTEGNLNQSVSITPFLHDCQLSIVLSIISSTSEKRSKAKRNKSLMIFSISVNITLFSIVNLLL